MTMKMTKAIIFDLDNTILDRTLTFQNFTRSFMQNYFDNHEHSDKLHSRIIYLDQDG